MKPEDQMRDALQAIETVLSDAYHRHFAECCGRRSEQGCCGDFIEQWTPEDHKILDTLSPIQRQLSQTLAHRDAQPAVAVNEALYQALRHLHHNAKKSGANMGLALDVAEDALKQAEKGGAA